MATVELIEVYICGKCGHYYPANEVKEFVEEKKPLNNFKCKICKNGDYWDLHHWFVNKDGDRMIEHKGKWYTEREWQTLKK